MRKETFNARGFISILLVLDLLVLTITGIGLFVAPSGRVARDIGFVFLGMSKETLESMHTVFGFMMIVLVVFHLVFNWDILVNYVYRLVKGVRKIRLREAIAALFITVFLILSSVYGFPPSSTLSGFGEKLSGIVSKTRSPDTANNNGVESRSIRGYMTIQEAASVLGVPVEKALKRLEDAGIKASPDTTIREIMDEYHMSSEDVSSIIKGVESSDQEVGS